MQRKGRHIMFYDTLNTEEQVSYLIKPIIWCYKKPGGNWREQKLGRIAEQGHFSFAASGLYRCSRFAAGRLYRRYFCDFGTCVSALLWI